MLALVTSASGDVTKSEYDWLEAEAHGVMTFVENLAKDSGEQEKIQQMLSLVEVKK